MIHSVPASSHLSSWYFFVLGKHQQNLERGKATLLLLLIEANITRLEIVQPELHILLGISIQWFLVRSGGKIVGNMAAT